MSDPHYPGFEVIFRSAIDKGKSRTEAIRAACRAWLEHCCREKAIQISSSRRDKLVTEGLKIYDEYRYDNRSHESSHTAAQRHIQSELGKYQRGEHGQGGGYGSHSGGPSGRGGGLDDMSDMFDSLPPQPHGHSSRPHHGGSDSSRPHHGGSSSRPHHSSYSSSSRPGYSPQHSPDIEPRLPPTNPKDYPLDPNEGWGQGTFKDGTPIPWWARKSQNQYPDDDSEEEEREFGPHDPSKYGNKPPKQHNMGGGGGGGYSSSRRPSSPTGSDYFDSRRQPPRHQSMGGGGGFGSSPRGYNTQEFRPGGSGGFSSGFGGDPFSRSSRPSGGMPDPFSMFDEFMSGGGGGGGGRGPRGYNTQEFHPTPGFDFGSEFGGGGRGPSSSRRPPANYDSDDGMGPPPPRHGGRSHGHGQGYRPSNSHRPSHGGRRNSNDSFHDLSSSDSPPHGGSSSHRRHNASSSSKPKPKPKPNPNSSSHRPPPPPPSSDLGIRPTLCFYKVLAIPRNASDSEIKTAYRKMSLKYHPDRAAASGLDKGLATRKMAEVNQAKDVLGDRGKRAWFDRTGCVRPEF